LRSWRLSGSIPYLEEKMNEDPQTQKDTHRIEHYEDEIELMDYLLVIWKWKYFILSGILVCGLIAAIISLKMDKVYSINMVLRPGILSIERSVYIDSPHNIKALIESETFNNDILKDIYNDKIHTTPKRLKFKVTIPAESDTMKVQYETANIKQGMAILEHLSKLLLETYSKLVQYFKSEYDMKLSLLEYGIDYLKTSIQSYKRNVKIMEKRIDELTSEIELIKTNTTNLIKERNKLLSKNPNENNILSALLYSNTIQQNLQLSNHYQDEGNKYKQNKEKELQKIEKSENEIAKKLNEKKSLQFKKDSIQNIQVLQPAQRSPYPIKPKTKLNVMLSLMVGLFLMLILAFFLEYLGKNRLRDSSLKQ